MTKVTDFRSTSLNYYETNLLMDLIPLIPLQFITLKRNR